MEPNLVKMCVDDLSSLRYRDEGTTRGIRVQHTSISDFLVSDDCSCDYRINSQDANTQLAIACLKTMASQLRFNNCGLKDSRLPNADVEDLPSRITENIPDSLQYSSLYWSFLTIIIGGCGKALRNSLKDRAHYSRLKSRAFWKWWR